MDSRYDVPKKFFRPCVIFPCYVLLPSIQHKFARLELRSAESHKPSLAIEIKQKPYNVLSETAPAAIDVGYIHLESTRHLEMRDRPLLAGFDNSTIDG